MATMECTCEPVLGVHGYKLHIHTYMYLYMYIITYRP